MPKTKRSNLLALAVLSLLNEKPMHPYEIGVVMRQRGLSNNIKLNTGSLYAVIDHLLKNGHISSVETIKEGNHPERTIYSLTDAGRDELLDWLKVLLIEPAKEYRQFAAGLSFLGHFTPKEVSELLRERRASLAALIEKTQSSIEAALHKGVQRMFLIETDYELALLEAEMKWITQLIRDIEEGDFTERKGDRWEWSLRYEEQPE